MADDYAFPLAGGGQTFRRSDTQVAVVPRPSRGRSLETTLDAMRQDGAARYGRLGRFEIVDMAARRGAAPAGRVALQANPAVREVASVYTTSADGVPFVPEGTITLALAEGAPEAALTAQITAEGLILAARTRSGAYVAVVPAGAEDAVEVAARLQSQPGIAYAEPDMVTPAAWLNVVPSDALLAEQWHLENRGAKPLQTPGADARVVAAWRRLGHLGSPDPVIGIIDDGFDLTHPDLDGAWQSPRDFVLGGEDVHPAPGNWHGTPCAGIALGRAEAGAAVGVAPNARFIPVRMRPEISAHDTAKWFDHLTDQGAWVISCSWNAEAADYALPTPIAEAITRAATEGRGGKGAVVVFAAGNSRSNINDPPHSRNGFAIHPLVLAVSASTSVDTASHYSCFGKEIAVAAPSSGRGGWGVTTIDTTGTYRDAAGSERPMGYDSGDYTGHFTGTSAACPVVAGIAALVLGANPDLTAAEVRDILRTTARRIGDDSAYVDGHSERFGHGCVNADAAVAAALARAGPQHLAAARAGASIG